VSRNYLVIPDPHSHPNHSNDRADWIGKFILDRKPDVVVNMGDTWDLPSLSSFDKGKASFNGANYEKDMNAGLDFQDRMWHPMKASKKKQPHKVFLEGNHERRLNKVLEYEPHLAGERYGISYSNFQLEHYYHDVVYYNGGTPGIYTIDDISFAHFFVSGLMGRPIGGDHHAASLLAKNYSSCVAAHSHTVDWAVRSGSNGKKIMGLVAGVYQDYVSGWAGNVNNLWWQGVVYLRNVEAGVYDPEFISIEALRRVYGGRK
jgi:hypothetical protein